MKSRFPAIAIVVALLLLANAALAQDTTKKETKRWFRDRYRTTSQAVNDTTDRQKSNVYAELGGSGIVASLNYERMFTEFLVGRIGLGAFPYSEGYGFLFLPIVPLSVSYLWGANEYKFELGLGVTVLLSGIVGGILPTGIIGYRYQPKGTGLLFRAVFTPLFNPSNPQLPILPWAGLSFGWNF